MNYYYDTVKLLTQKDSTNSQAGTYLPSPLFPDSFLEYLLTVPSFYQPINCLHEAENKVKRWNMNTEN